MTKIDGRTLDHKTLEHLRMLAVKRVVEGGERPAQVAISLGLCRTSIYPWLRTFHDQGWEALAESIAEGPECKLTEKQCQQVRRWILGADASGNIEETGRFENRVAEIARRAEREVGGMKSVGSRTVSNSVPVVLMPHLIDGSSVRQRKRRDVCCGCFWDRPLWNGSNNNAIVVVRQELSDGAVRAGRKGPSTGWLALGLSCGSCCLRW